MIGNTPISVSSNNYPQIPGGMYTAEIIDVNIVQASYNQKPYKKLVFSFSIMNDGITTDGKPLKGQILMAGSKLNDNGEVSLGSNSNTFKIFSAALGRTPSQSEKQTFHPDNIVGRQIQIIVEQRTSDKGNTYSNAVGFSPVAGQATAAPAPQVSAQAVAPVAQAPVTQAPAPVASQGVQVAQTPVQGGNGLPWENK